jgi:hypothetical protein
MARRPFLVIPLITLLAAVTAACGGASTGTSALHTVTVTVTHAPATTSMTSATAAVTATAAVEKTVTPTTTTTAPPASAVSYSAFLGEWVGHTRFVTVSKTGRIEEHVGDGCCDPIIDLVLQLSNPHRAGKTWVATSRVMSATPHKGWKGTGRPAPKPGDHGTVTVGADYILVDSITDNGFCDQDKTEPGACGA